MYGQGAHSFAPENLYGHYYVSLNEWQNDYNATNGLRGLNLKGAYCMLDYQQTDPDLKYKSIHVGPGTNHNGATAQENVAVGILADDMILGVHKLTGVWVRVLIVGYTERLLVAEGEDDTHGFVYLPNAVSKGQAYLFDGESVFSSATNLRLTGVATIDTSGATAIMDLSGVDTATVTWGANDKPGVDRSATTGVTGAGASTDIQQFGTRCIGWRVRSQGDLKVVTEVTENKVYRLNGAAFLNPPHMTPAFVNFFNAFRGWI
jgi:hypothetical protein